MEKEINVLAISYAKRVLQDGSHEQERMKRYSTVVTRYKMIVFTRKTDCLPKIRSIGNLTVYGTDTYTKIGMLFEAYKIGKKILNENKKNHWIVSSQDPFETSIVGQILSRPDNASHHIQLHGDPFSGDAWKQESVMNRLRAVFGRFYLRNASSIRTVSRRAQKSLVTLGISSEKISIVPIQQDLSQFLSVGQSRVYKEKATSIFTFVGRLSPEKNINRIIRVFAEAYATDVTIRLHIVGEGKCESALRKQVVDLSLDKVVTFIPWTDSVSKEMAQSDVFLLASSHEGYAMVLVEAMATGLPIITTDVGCVGEIVINHKECVVVSFDDDLEFVDSILKFAGDSKFRKEMGQQGYASARFIQKKSSSYNQRWKDSFSAT